MNTYRAGIDIGSTTVKLVLLDENGKILFGQYRRHCAHTQQTLKELLAEAREQVGSCLLQVKITGSGTRREIEITGADIVGDIFADGADCAENADNAENTDNADGAENI